MPPLISQDSMQRAVNPSFRNGNEDELCQRLELLKANFARQGPNTSLNSSSECTPLRNEITVSPLLTLSQFLPQLILASPGCPIRFKRRASHQQIGSI